jgi:ABC-type transporter MlaC component
MTYTIETIMNNIINRIILVLLLCLLTLNVLPLSAFAQTGKESIESLIKVFSTLRGHHWELDPTQLADAAKYIDYRDMAQRALGEREWHKLSDAQKKNYLQSFKSLIERRYYTRWHRIFAKSKITYGAEARKDSDVLVNSTITTGNSTKSVVWTLAGELPKVVNLTVGDKDLLKVVQPRFQRKIAAAGMPAFLSWLQKKSKQVSDDDVSDQ